MAATYRTSVAGGNATGAAVAVAITPAVGDLLVVWAAENGPNAGNTTTISDTQSGAWTSIRVHSVGSSPVTAGNIWIRNQFIENTTSTTVTVTPSPSATAAEVIVVAVAGMAATGLSALRASPQPQQSINDGLGGTTPATTVLSTTLTTNLCLSFVADLGNPPGITAPTSWTRDQNVGQTGLGCCSAHINSGFTSTTVTWGSSSATQWVCGLLEFDPTARGGVYQAVSGKVAQQCKVGRMDFSTVFTAFRPFADGISDVLIPVLQGSTPTIPIVMRSSNTGVGVPGLSSTLLTELKKSGAAFGTITPTTITDRGGGSYDVVLTGSHTNTLGVGQLRFTCTSTVGHDPIVINDQVFIDVIAVDRTDAVRYGLSALPNSAAGTAEGVALSEQVTNIAVTGAALNTTAASRAITSGTGTGGVTNTTQADGVYDSVADATGTVDFYYQFDLSGTTNAVGVGVQWTGYLTGVANVMKVYAYNWGATAWEQLDTIPGIAGTTNGVEEWELTSAHTGTGGNAGLVRIRFSNTGLSGASVKTDRVLLGYAVTPLTSIGTVNANVTQWAGGAVPAPNATGTPKVDVVDWLGTAPSALASGLVRADVEAWKTSTPNALVSGRVDADVGNVEPAAVTQIQTGLPTAASIDTQLSGTHGAGSWGGGSATVDDDAIANAVVKHLIAVFGDNTPHITSYSAGIEHTPTARAIRSLENVLRRLTGQ